MNIDGVESPLARERLLFMRTLGGAMAQRVKHRSEGSDPNDAVYLPGRDSDNVEDAIDATRDAVEGLASLSSAIASAITSSPSVSAAHLGAKLAVHGATVEGDYVRVGVGWAALTASSDYAAVSAN